LHQHSRNQLLQTTETFAPALQESAPADDGELMSSKPDFSLHSQPVHRLTSVFFVMDTGVFFVIDLAAGGRKLMLPHWKCGSLRMLGQCTRLSDFSLSTVLSSVELPQTEVGKNEKKRRF